MRVLLLTALTLLVAIGSAQARTLLDAGLVAVDADGITSTPGCVVGVDPELCLVGYDDAGTPFAIGDDTITTAKAIDTLRVDVRPPVGAPSQRIEVQPSLSIHHDVYHALNATCITANDTLPASVKQVATCDSRAMVRDPHPWGVFVTVHVPLQLGDEAFEPAAGVCWDICVLYDLGDNVLVASNETTLQLLPHNAALFDGDSDATVSSAADAPGACLSYLPQACSFQQAAAPTIAEVAAQLEASTPDVVEGFHFNRTLLDSGDSERVAFHHASASSSGASSFGHGSAHPMTMTDPRMPGGRAESLPAASRPWALANSSADTPALASAGTDAASVDGSEAPLLAAVACAALAAAGVLYHRITGDRAARHRHRATILAYLAEHPGTDVADIGRHTGLSFKSAFHHVSVLQRSKLVRVQRLGRRTVVSLADDGTDARLSALLRHPRRREVLILVRARPGIRQSDLARVLGVGRNTLHRHVAALRDSGAIRVEHGGLHAAGMATLGPAQESTPAPRDASSPA